MGAHAALPGVRLWKPGDGESQSRPGVLKLTDGDGGVRVLELTRKVPFPEPTAGSQIRVGLKQVADLRAEGMADPYARISVSTQAGRRHETKVHHGTLCPVFEETCSFHVSPGRG